ncbi:hypothetical protein [Streptomyces sp. GSL17-111]|uniref:hypothetical protein n=1 Tax=Streptomyces sp. GSL17-111 TaxID=3121596 RepID=UPI0030F3E5A3
MQKHPVTAATATATAATAEATEAVPAQPGGVEDPAGQVTLSGRNRACARARVLAGLVLTSGVVVTLSQMDTSVSAPS